MANATNAETRRALIEQAHQLNELTKHPGWAILMDYANYQVMAPVKKRILNDTNIVDIAEYKRIAGFVIGVHRALDIPKEVQALADNARKRAAEHDEDDAA